MKIVTGRANPANRYELIAPLSVAGQRPDYDVVLPALGKDSHNRRMAVGSASNHMVFRFNFDDKSGQGKWNYLYSEYDGYLISE
jgi:hypothetical protein